MTTLQLEIEDELLALLDQSSQPASQAAKELIVMELYRRRRISGGKAAEILGFTRQDFIVRAGKVGIPQFEMSDAEWEDERTESRKL